MSFWGVYKNMKIAQVGNYPLSSNCIRGGVEASVYGLVNELIQQGQKVYVFDFPRMLCEDRVEQDGQVCVYRYKNAGKHNEDAVTRTLDIVRDIEKLHPDIIHIHGTGAISKDIFLSVRHYNIPIILTIHGLLRVEKHNKLKIAVRRPWRVKALLKATYQFVKQNRVECAFLQEVDNAIVDTEYLVVALKKYPIKKLPNLYVIPQGANDRFFSVQNQVPKVENRILCVGAFGVRKGQKKLIRAFEKLRYSGVDAQLVLCGVVAEEDYFRQIQAMAEASNYRNDIEVKKNLSANELISEYQKATIFALHSQEESQGIVLAEAMAMGLPIVSTKVGGIPYVVEDGKTGLLTDFGDVEATAMAMEKLLQDKTIYNEYSKNAVVASQRYQWCNIANEIIELYKACKMPIV